VAGKTGTAQKADSLMKGYSEDCYISGFMGFAPVEDPKLALLVVIDEPQGNIYGGIVAAPAFREIMMKVLPHLNVFPDGTLIVKNEAEFTPRREQEKSGPLVERVKMEEGMGREVMPDLTGLSLRSAMSRIEGRGLIIKVSGNGRVVDQTPKAGTVIEKGDICYIKFQAS